MTSTQPKIQHIFKPVDLWSTQDLITLDSLKVALRIDAADTTKDAELTMVIDGVSAQIASMANRSFGYDHVQETFYNAVEEDRIYFSQWPVVLSDINLLTSNGTDMLATHGQDWILEEQTGTMFFPGGAFSGTIYADYSGGYKIPDEAPADLARVAFAAAREDYYIYVRGAVLSGVRMISHKHARVMYYPPGQVSATAQGSANMGPAGSNQTWQAVWSVVQKYVRHWV